VNQTRTKLEPGGVLDRVEDMAADERNDHARRLGAEIRNRRMARGMSLRALAKELGLSGHGTLVDYEHGRRIPPEDLVVGCERVFQVSDGALRNLREKALAERADRNTENLLSTEPPRPRSVRRRLVVVAVVLGLAGSIAVWQWGFAGQQPEPRSEPGPVREPVAAGPVRFGFENGDQRWTDLWSNDNITWQATSAAAYEGRQSLQITSTLESDEDDKSIGITHGLETLRPGMKVSVQLRVPAEQDASVRFFAYDSEFTASWAPESPPGGELALPTDTEWTEYVWTVPEVDEVLAIGMEIYQETDDPVTIWLDAVAWR
jgi:transcriptional regulator with XRE-family HTH domain